jgi:wyosine [tRNA(Phe)-imidazoG37] synthetase (radical SAM superfamily)
VDTDLLVLVKEQVQMIDIKWYQAIWPHKRQLMDGDPIATREYIEREFNHHRSKVPVIYNLETTNSCNMRCKMCPRTTMMTRPVKTMSLPLAKRIIDQLTPWTAEEWTEWEHFVADKYHVWHDEMSENNFFLYVIPKVIVLHGYGDPLLDPHMPDIVGYLTKKNIPSYFSCNPANINIGRTLNTFENGLSYIKYSIEAVDDAKHKAIRGEASNFWESYRNIVRLLDMKQQHNYPVQIVITMLNLGREGQEEEYGRLVDAFRDMDVYIYLKSQDQQWYPGQVQTQTQSIHWQEFCQFPFSSMTIKSDGLSVECVEDFNNEIVLGDARTESLYDIWNGEKYEQFRRDHFNLTPGIKCMEQCDMTLVGQLLAKG